MTSDNCPAAAEASDACSSSAAASYHDQALQQKSLHIAPMLHVSNREFRQLFRILSKKAVLWTEMVVDETLAFTKNVQEHLGYDTGTCPLVCQIGGNTPEYAKRATKLVEEFNYVEINLNVDCPSDRVSGKREFGAVLMKQKETCIRMLQAMQETARDIPISIKTRIGIDDYEDFDSMVDFIDTLRPFCKRFHIHARKCILKGLSPAQNRIVPPLNYPRVYALCRRFPDCDFYINGGIAGLRQAKLIVHGNGDASEEHTGAPCVQCKASNGSCVAPPSPRAPSNLRGCMLGRAAMDNPCLFWDVDRYFYGEDSNPCQNRRQVLEQYCAYLERTYPRRCCDSDKRMTLKIPAPDIVRERECCPVCRNVYGNENSTCVSDNHTEVELRKAKISSRVIDRSLKPVLGIFFGLPKAKMYRRVCDQLSRDMVVRNCGPGFILRMAMNVMPEEILDRAFVKTEDLSDADIVSHIAPRTGGSCC